MTIQLNLLRAPSASGLPAPARAWQTLPTNHSRKQFSHGIHLSSSPGTHPDNTATGLAQTGSTERTAGEAECRRTMRDVLEARIIPRLLAVSREGADPDRLANAAITRAAEIEALARACARGDHTGALAVLDALQNEGLATEDALTELIAPAALWLGQAWEDDRMGFDAVTVGLTLLHELVHTLGYGNHGGPQGAGAVRRIMLASAPGSQHVLGLSIVSEFFSNAGWEVVLEISATPRELLQAVRDEWFEVIGLSVALDEQLRALPRLVADLRAASRNPGCAVLLGGPVFGLRPMDAAQFGAHAICLDARESVGLAQSLADPRH
ncbi:cobalamin B12-binding domain-containing protein [Piscinibacterium candidicorallinum]|uniref:B12-binding domain-containing protein n=1 Tax=Piscinibacterium candidicorallinum TaxID=1793872 RepID=A0ABV7GXN3_9BURK